MVVARCKLQLWRWIVLVVVGSCSDHICHTPMLCIANGLCYAKFRVPDFGCRLLL